MPIRRVFRQGDELRFRQIAVSSASVSCGESRDSGLAREEALYGLTEDGCVFALNGWGPQAWKPVTMRTEGTMVEVEMTEADAAEHDRKERESE